MIRFKFMTGDINWLDYGGQWVSNKQNNGDFDYWLVLELINMNHACGRDNKGQPLYNVSLSAVSPQEAGKEGLKKALDSIGGGEDFEKQFESDPIMQVEALHGYGISSPIQSWDGNNAYKLLKEARKEAQFLGGMLFGFMMDKQKNQIGTTGWEALRGDMDSALVRTIGSGSTTGRILGKMYGVKPEDINPELKAATQQQEGEK